MIGLGSNRLTVCRRGGMSVTQAGKGGMEWLAGDGLRGRTPYSAQATAALKAQFPTQWPTIRDYGFSHPALVPFINEDPMLVMDLISGLGIRGLYIISTSSSNYLDTGVPQYAEHSMKVTFDIIADASFASNSTNFFGIIGDLNNKSTFISFAPYVYSGKNIASAVLNSGTNNFVTLNGTLIGKKKHIEIDINIDTGKMDYCIDGELIQTYNINANVRDASRTIKLYKSAEGSCVYGSGSNYGKIGLSAIKIERDGVIDIDYVVTNQEVGYRFLDKETLTLVQFGTGSTISETPAS